MSLTPSPPRLTPPALRRPARPADGPDQRRRDHLCSAAAGVGEWVDVVPLAGSTVGHRSCGLEVSGVKLGSGYSASWASLATRPALHRVDLVVWERSAAKAKRLAGAGATTASSPVEVVEQAEVVVLMLATCGVIEALKEAAWLT